MLRNEVGTENFWTAIREYYRRYRNTNTSTAELRAIFEQIAGKNLEWFFTQWLTRPGVPTIEGSWSYDAIKKVVSVTVTQSQAAPARRDDRHERQTGRLHIRSRRRARCGDARSKYDTVNGRGPLRQTIITMVR